MPGCHQPSPHRVPTGQISKDQAALEFSPTFSCDAGGTNGCERPDRQFWPSTAFQYRLASKLSFKADPGANDATLRCHIPETCCNDRRALRLAGNRHRHHRHCGTLTAPSETGWINRNGTTCATALSDEGRARTCRSHRGGPERGVRRGDICRAGAPCPAVSRDNLCSATWARLDSARVQARQARAELARHGARCSVHRICREQTTSGPERVVACAGLVNIERRSIPASPGSESCCTARRRYIRSRPGLFQQTPGCTGDSKPNARQNRALSPGVGQPAPNLRAHFDFARRVSVTGTTRFRHYALPP